MTKLLAAISPLADVRNRIELVQGQHGANRSDQHCQIDAESDLEAVGAWLSAVAGGSAVGRSDDTHRTYLKEAKRLMTWLSIDRGIPLSGVRANDLHAYRAFLLCPEPASLYCSTVVDGGLGLFRGGLSERSANHSLVIIRGLFRFLTDNNYLRGNPFPAFGKVKFSATDAQGRVHESTTPVINDREVREEWITAMLEGMAEKVMAKGLISDRRDLWVFVLLAFTGMRRSEACMLPMNAFYLSEEDGWFVSVVGKGKKARTIPVADIVIQSLLKYRDVLGCTTPLRQDESPAIQATKGEKDRFMSSTQIYRIVKKVADTGIKRLVAKGLTEEAVGLEKFTPHLFRRRFTTKLLRDGAALIEVSRMLGHESVTTTQIYAVKSQKIAAEAIRSSFSGISIGTR